MTRVWKIVFWFSVTMLTIGLVLAGAGWLTGASSNRIIETCFGSTDAIRTIVIDYFTKGTETIHSFIGWLPL